MRIAYLITAYRELEQLRRLHQALTVQDPESLIHVQFDIGSPFAPRAAQLPYRMSFTKRPVRWGDGTYVLALVESLRQLVAEPWDWLVVLSGQDYPLRPLEDLHVELQTSAHRAYAPVTGRSHGPDAPPQQLIERYMYRYTWPGHRAPLAVRAAARELGPGVEALSRGRLRLQQRPRDGAPGLGIRRRRTIFSGHRPCWMGPDYVAMGRSMALSLLETLDGEPEVLRYYVRTFVPSESLFTSVLRWIDADAVADRNFHFMRFAGNANPRRIEPADLPELWDTGRVFARKFDDGSEWVESELPMRCAPS